jgi:hypothetical protein
MKHEIFLEIDIKDICVPPEKCLTVKPGYVKADTLSKMDRENYDYAPVVNDKCVYGLTGKELLRSLHKNNRVLSPELPEVSDRSNFFEVPHSCVTITQILEKMSNSMAVLVFETGHVEHHFISNFIGLMTLSDLNRHEIRFTLFRLITALESTLEKVIRNFFSDPNDWLKKLNENDQVRILGYCELAKRKNMETDFIEATQLTNLLNIVAKTKEIIEVLKYKSRTDFEKQTGYISELRNQVMHVVRPLIIKQGDVLRLLESINFIEDLIKRLKNALQSIQPNAD